MDFGNNNQGQFGAQGAAAPGAAPQAGGAVQKEDYVDKGNYSYLFPGVQLDTQVRTNG